MPPSPMSLLTQDLCLLRYSQSCCWTTRSHSLWRELEHMSGWPSGLHGKQQSTESFKIIEVFLILCEHQCLLCYLQGVCQLSNINFVYGHLKCTKSDFNIAHFFLYFRIFCLVVLQLILNSKLSGLQQFENWAVNYQLASIKGGNETKKNQCHF